MWGSLQTGRVFGELWKHGHGVGQTECPGSHRLPQPNSTSSLGQASDLDQPVVIHDSLSGPDCVRGFEFPAPSRPTLRRIPHGARLKAAAALESRLRSVITSSGDLDCWTRLLCFAECLSQPTRGGKRFNLTTRIVTQIDQSQGRQSPNVPVQNYLSRVFTPKCRDRKANEESEEELLVRRASSKLQEGDISGAVRCLNAEETLAPWSGATFLSL